jgi:hypothetical protein
VLLIGMTLAAIGVFTHIAAVNLVKIVKKQKRGSVKVLCSRSVAASVLFLLIDLRCHVMSGGFQAGAGNERAQAGAQQGEARGEASLPWLPFCVLQ